MEKRFPVWKIKKIKFNESYFACSQIPSEGVPLKEFYSKKKKKNQRGKRLTMKKLPIRRGVVGWPRPYRICFAAPAPLGAQIVLFGQGTLYGFFALHALNKDFLY